MLCNVYLGDLTTLGVLSMFGTIFLNAHLTESWLNILIILGFVVITPIWARKAAQEPTTKEVCLFLFSFLFNFNQLLKMVDLGVE